MQCSTRSCIRWLLLVGLASGLLAVPGCSTDGSSDSEPLSARERTMRNRAQKILSRARTALDQDQYNRALKLIERAESVDSTYAWVPFLRGEVYRSMSNVEEAREAYERALELDDGHPEVRLRLGDLARATENYEEALDWYRRQRTLVENQLKQRNWTYDELPRGSRIATLMRQVPVREARTLAVQGRNEEAIDRLRQALDRDPRHATAHYYLAQILREEGQTTNALEQARKAVDLQPEMADYRYTLAKLLLDENRPKEAIPHLRHVLERRPSHVGAHYNLGQALIRTGQKEEGKKYMTRSDSLRSLQQKINQARVTARGQRDNPARWLELAHLLRQADRFGESIDAYRTTLAIDSTLAEAWLGLGITYGQAGRREAARRALRRALDLEPGNDDARRYLQQLSSS